MSLFSTNTAISETKISRSKVFQCPHWERHTHTHTQQNDHFTRPLTHTQPLIAVLSQELEDSAEDKFYCLHALASGLGRRRWALNNGDTYTVSVSHTRPSKWSVNMFKQHSLQKLGENIKKKNEWHYSTQFCHCKLSIDVFQRINKVSLAFFFAHKSLHRAALVQQMTKMQDLVSSDVEVPEIRTLNNNGCNFIRANTCKNDWNDSAFFWDANQQ